MSDDLIYAFAIMSYVCEDSVPLDLIPICRGQVEGLRVIIDVGVSRREFKRHVEQTGLKLKESTLGTPQIKKFDGQIFWVQDHELESYGLIVASLESTNAPELYLEYLKLNNLSVDRTWW